MYAVGNKLRISLFGRSHADCIGCIIEGLPLGIKIDTNHIIKKMSQRKPSEGIGTGRKEEDEVVFESGVTDSVITSGTVLLSITNKNVDPSSYSGFSRTPRPGHADLPALMKFRDFDVSGGAQFSGRMTAPLVAAGAIAEQFLMTKGIEIAAYTKSIYDITDDRDHSFDEIKRSSSFRTRAVDSETDAKMSQCIIGSAKEGDSVGGIVSCTVIGLPIGFGGIWFDALDVSLARMMFAIPGVKGVEFGKGFGITRMKGSESNDQYHTDAGNIVSSSNNMGGVCGGMSDGMPLTFDVALKPTPSIAKEQRTVDLETMTDTSISIKGRHDPCIVPRAVPVVEAMAALAIMDQFLSE